MKYYKYIQREHFDKFLNHGELRIGTLHKYRPQEIAQIEADAAPKISFNTEIYDSNEGKVSITDYVERLTYTPEKPLPPIWNKSIDIDPFSKPMPKNRKGTRLGMFYISGQNIEHENTTRVEIVKSSTSFQDEAPNALIYCLNKIPTKAVMRAFEADVCFEISNIELFISVLGIKLFQSGLTTGERPVFHDCFYNGHEVNPGRRFMFNYKGGKCIRVDRTSWLKNPKYSHQCESRIVFPLKAEFAHIKYKDICVPEIKHIIKEYKFQ